VFAFVIVAGAVSFAGLDPETKAEAGSVAADNVVDNSAQEKDFATSKKEVVIANVEATR
jgi:hypothetical protein